MLTSHAQVGELVFSIFNFLFLFLSLSDLNKNALVHFFLLWFVLYCLCHRPRLHSTGQFM